MMGSSLRRKVFSVLGTVLGLGMLALALWIFEKTLAQYELAEALQRFRDIPTSRLVLALLFVAASYFTQSLYDWLSLAALGKGRAPLGRATLAGMVSNALVNNMGFSWLTATSLRFRFYSAWGYRPLEIAQVVAMTKLAFFGGLAALAGATQLAAPVPLPGRIGDLLSPLLLGCLLLSAPVLLVIWNAWFHGESIRLGKLHLPRPGQRILILQFAASALHLVFAAVVLYLLLPQDALRSAGLAGGLAFLSVFMALKFVVLFFPIPGGLGVLEGTAVALLAPAMPAYPLLGGLLAFRILYYLVPFGIALCVLMIVRGRLPLRPGRAARIEAARRERGKGTGRADQRAWKPRNPRSGLSVTETSDTWAWAEPRRHQRTKRSNASRGPSASAYTDPSSSLRTKPCNPSRAASALAEAR